MNEAEAALKTLSQGWPTKLVISEGNLANIKEQALKEGVSEEFFDKWCDDNIEVLTPLEQLDKAFNIGPNEMFGR